MDPQNKTDLALLGIALILTGAVLGYTAFDAPPLAAPAVTYTPPAVVVSGTKSGAQSAGASAGKASSHAAASSKAASGRASSLGNTASPAPDPAGPRINLNTATLDELMRLCDLKIGIGQSTVQNIYDYRETYGPFSSAGDLILIRGIGERRLEQLLPYVYVDEP